MSIKKIPVWLGFLIILVSYTSLAILTEVFFLPLSKETAFIHLLINDFSQIGFFLLGGYFFSVLAYGEDVLDTLGFSKIPTTKVIVICILISIIIQPITLFLSGLQFFFFEVVGMKDFVETANDIYMSVLKTLFESDDMAQKVFAIFSLTVVPSICEETLFRGYLQTRLSENSLSFWKPIIITGVLFGLFHLDPIHLIELVAVGILLCFTKAISGSIWPAVVIHFTNNFMFSTIVLPESEITGLDPMALAKSTLTPIGIGITLVSIILFIVLIKALKKQY